jgi:hypothetical protein
MIGRDIRIENIGPSLRTRLIEVLLDFAELNIEGALRDGENLHAVAGLVELRRVYSGLVMVYPEFREVFEPLDAGLDRLLVASRTQLLKVYLRSHDVDEVKAISETLGAIIAAGKWPDWSLDFDMAIEERCSSPSIQSKLKLVSNAVGRA